MTSHENVPHGTLPPGHGELPPWNVAELEAPPRFSFRNALKVIGPGAIMAATSIGGGEWLVGPAAAVKYAHLDQFMAFQADVDFVQYRRRQAGLADHNDGLQVMRPGF